MKEFSAIYFIECPSFKSNTDIDIFVQVHQILWNNREQDWNNESLIFQIQNKDDCGWMKLSLTKPADIKIKKKYVSVMITCIKRSVLIWVLSKTSVVESGSVAE